LVYKFRCVGPPADNLSVAADGMVLASVSLAVLLAWNNCGSVPNCEPCALSME
jgi:hypothetical protein